MGLIERGISVDYSLVVFPKDSYSLTFSFGSSGAPGAIF